MLNEIAQKIKNSYLEKSILVNKSGEYVIADIVNSMKFGFKIIEEGDKQFALYFNEDIQEFIKANINFEDVIVDNKIGESDLTDKDFETLGAVVKKIIFQVDKNKQKIRSLLR